MARPAWQIEVPMTYLNLEERLEIEEKLSMPLTPEEALVELEEIYQAFGAEVTVRLREMHLAGVRITIEVASQIETTTKENDE